ncbi:endolytic transglycosylase MltG [Reinekea marinisedimentorum]|uniref:Endolytic murein transglycosylase n=1 Tax=Reinekea marinisedimentorum TaxID=230495 RepID=A0A4R3I8T8_9GAMM|nr:endolytic transglycosylase MltG [Reinekea marinisedimentorum]TCS42554.1 UPF0755 protein [Reinekea marinisedimentorum]
MSILAKKLLGLVFLLVVAIGLAILSFSYNELNRTVAFENDAQTYIVKKGSSVKRVLLDFKSEGWIEYPRIHELWLRYHQKTNIQSGEYEIASNQSVEQIIDQFIRGDKILRSVQFIEGKTVRDYLTALQAHEHLDQTLANMSVAEITAKIDPELKNLEGWLYPDTYLFESGTSDLEILSLAYKKMQQVLERQWLNKSEDAAVNSAYEALILASIVEKETGAAFERAEIAGVFTRRLNIGMRLQTDPTVIYGLGPDFDGNITRKDLRTDTPYNTYTRYGLPPTPIANPGEDAIFAALNPAAGNTLYFVAKGDGTHYFSSTLKEHNNAVIKYQRFGRRKDYQSSPAAEESQ